MIPAERPLLMIPGPVEISAAVRAAGATAPPGHLAPDFVATFGRALGRLRRVWRAADDATPFVVSGSGTLAMEAAVSNLLEPGEPALVVNTGYFGDRMAEMLRRRGAAVHEVGAGAGEVPRQDAVAAALEKMAQAGRRCKALFATHVDTSTAVRVEPAPLARLAREHGALAVFDGVCATAAERFEMAAWDADVYLTASQKALGLPPGIGLWVASPRALEARRALRTPPPLTLDWEAWRPVMEAYEAGRGAYFSTPPTTLVLALEVGLAEILAEGADPEAALEAVAGRHERAARALRRAWEVLDLVPLPVRPETAANTLSALRYPAGRGPELVAAIREQGVIVAAGLLPGLAPSYFRVGHMGVVTRNPEPLQRTVRAVATAVAGPGSPRVAEALDAFAGAWG